MNQIVYPRNKKIYVIGPLKSKFNQVIDFVNSSENCIFIFNGGICYGSDEEINNKINIFKSLKDKNNVYYNANSEDLIHLKKLKDNLKFNKSYDWIGAQHLITKIDFVNQTRMIIVSGGINTENYKKSLFDNIEVCFISCINNRPWHDFYNGDIGYVISNNPPCKELQPKIYNYSCSIGVEDENKVLLQEVDSQGLKDFFII